MNVWCHLPTIFKQRRSLQIAALLTLCVALITTLFFSISVHAAPGVNQTISFQGRLLDSHGGVVPDGNYNIQFKIYQDGSGAQAGNPDGTLKWTETYVNNGGTSGVPVKNGYLSVNLGSQTPFGTSIDWNQDTLWLSMNIAGSSAGCTTFNTYPCASDGEMLPMKRITSTPYSLNSGQVGGKTVNQLVQLGQGTQTDASNTSSIAINKTGSGNLLQLQNTATDVFTIGNAGDITFGNNAAHSIAVAQATANATGIQLTVSAGTGGSGTGSTGGTLSLSGGAAGGTNGNGGNITLDGGSKTGSGNDGSISIGTGSTSSITIGSNTSGQNQTVSIGANDTARITLSGDSNTAYLGNGSASNAPTDFKFQATNSTSDGVAGGSLAIQGGNATTGNTNGGNITLSGGAGSGSGAKGLVIISTPTFATTTDDANCYTSGALVATSCTITSTSLNNSSVLLVGFSATGQTATLPDPTITTAGRLVYIMGANNSKDFSLTMNGGGTGNLITLRANSAATLMWNGSDWVVTGSSADSILQGTDKGGDTNVQIGDGSDTTTPTLLTLDKATTAPTVTDTTAMLGSMYYDTTLGEVQCYEADGWGACAAKPDNFVTLSPQYSNAVTNGTGIGTMDSDICSDALNINDGSSGQPTICGTDETYNYYNWTSTQTTTQTKSIYVTYQLPTSFKAFIEGSTSLLARTDSTDSTVSYQLYRNSSTGLTACGSAIQASTGTQTNWQKAVATSGADPAQCGFEAGDSLVIKISLSAKDSANAYASTLNFAFSNK
ncbi:hypothetical protein J0I05_00080 [Candidatus Saccharibacteria bacterium]|nr:hypothetical protein [Candidatus Saccharibacteria bacterium]